MHIIRCPAIPWYHPRRFRALPRLSEAVSAIPSPLDAPSLGPVMGNSASPVTRAMVSLPERSVTCTKVSLNLLSWRGVVPSVYALLPRATELQNSRGEDVSNSEDELSLLDVRAKGGLLFGSRAGVSENSAAHTRAVRHFCSSFGRTTFSVAGAFFLGAIAVL